MADRQIGFRVREPDILTVHRGLIGFYKNADFFPTTNFVCKAIGLIRQEING